MATPLEKQELPPLTAAQPWQSDVLAEAYARKADTHSSGLNWKEVAGIGLAVVAGTALIAYGGTRLVPLLDAMRGGEAGVVSEGTSALSADVAARLRNVDHFVFDMDRTLVDHDGALAALKSTMTDGLVQETGLSREYIGDALRQTTDRLNSPYFWNRMDEIRPLQEQFPGLNLNERFASVAEQSKQAYYNALKATPETHELLDYLHMQGKSVHVFTAGNPARALEKLNAAGLLNKVDSIYTSGVHPFEDSAASGLLTKESTNTPIISLAETAKADGSGYERILRDLHTKGAKVAMTGDHPVEDVANSNAHGYFTSQALWYRHSPIGPVAPDLQLSSPSQLTALLRSGGKLQI